MRSTRSERGPTRTAKGSVATLVARGRAAGTPVALVESASLPERRVQFTVVSELLVLAARAGSGPAVILLGEVLSEQLEAQLETVRRSEARAVAA